MKQWELYVESHNTTWVDPDLSRLVRTLERLCVDLTSTCVTLRRTRPWTHPSMRVVPLRTSRWS